MLTNFALANPPGPVAQRLSPVTPGEGHLWRSREDLQQLPGEGGLVFGKLGGKTGGEKRGKNGGSLWFIMS